MSANFLSGLFKNWGWTIIREIWALFSASGSVFCVVVFLWHTFSVTSRQIYFVKNLICPHQLYKVAARKSSAGKLSWRRYFLVLRLEFWSNPLHQGLKDHLDDTCCIIGISSASCFHLIVDPRSSSPVLHCWDTAWSPPRQSGYNMKALKLVYVWCLRCIK